MSISYASTCTHTTEHYLSVLLTVVCLETSDHTYFMEAKPVLVAVYFS